MNDLSADIDALRTINTRFIKPLTRVMEVFDRAVAVQGEVLDIEARLAAMQQEEHDTRNRLQTLAAALATRESEVEDARRQSSSTIGDLERSMREATLAAQEVIRSAEESAAARTAVLNADYATRQTLLQAEIEALEARKKALEDTFATIRASVAAVTGTL